MSYKKLQSINSGSYSLGWFSGWLDVRHVDAGPTEFVDVIWTSHKNHHCALSRHRAYLVRFEAHGKVSTYEHLITAWHVDDSVAREKILQRAEKHIDKIYDETKDILNAIKES